MTNVSPSSTILEIGLRVTRFGIAGCHSPRVTVPTPQQLVGPIRGKLTPRPNNILYPFLQRYCFANTSVTGVMYLIVNLEDNAIWVKYLKDVLMRVYHCKDVVIVPAPIAAVHSSGYRTGLSIDVGAESARVCSVVHGFLYPNPLHCFELAPCGTDCITRRFIAVIKQSTGASKLLDADLQDGSVVENTVAKYAVVAPKTSAEPKMVLTRLRHVTLNVNPSMAAEAFFDDSETDDGLTLPHMLLRALLRADVTVRKELAQNIVLSGGGACIPGLLERLAQEVIELLEKDICYQALIPVRSSIRFFMTDVSRNQLAYFGCSAAVKS